MRLNARTGKLVIEGEEGTSLWCRRETVKQLTRIADSLEELLNAKNVS